MTQWSETLPEQCPPSEAYIPNEEVFYRLCNSDSVSEDDFLSQRAICPSCNYNRVSECITLSVSIWDNIDKCLDIKKLPRHKNKAIVQIELNSKDGLVLSTFKQNHYSWWRTKAFDINSAKTVK